jgi:hypothetical protein
MTNIDRRIQLFSFVRNQAYNVRALGSLEAENLFGEFQDLVPKGEKTKQIFQRKLNKLIFTYKAQQLYSDGKYSIFSNGGHLGWKLRTCLASFKT